MEEEEKLEIRKHLIKWVDTFLKDGIVPKVVNPKAIKANYILKSKVKDKIEELKKQDKEWTEELSEPDSNFKNIDRNLKRIKNQTEVLKGLLESEEN